MHNCLSLFVDASTVEHITNVQLFEIFKYFKNSRFDKDPDFEVLKQVCLKFNVHSSDKLMVNIKAAFQEYKSTRLKYRSMAIASRKTEEHACLLRHNYVKSRIEQSNIENAVPFS